MSLTPAQTFARLDRAHAAWTRGEATLVVSTATAQGTSRAVFRLDLDGSGNATLRIATPARGKLAATDQGFILRGSRLTGIDYDAKETIRRPAPNVGAIGLRFTAVLGGLEDAVGFLTAAGIRNRYLVPFRVIGGWRPTATGLVRRTVVAGKRSFTQLDLDPSGRLRGLHVELPGSKLDWRIAYKKARLLTVPRGFRRVEAFTVRPRPAALRESGGESRGRGDASA